MWITHGSNQGISVSDIDTPSEVIVMESLCLDNDVKVVLCESGFIVVLWRLGDTSLLHSLLSYGCPRLRKKLFRKAT